MKRWHVMPITAAQLDAAARLHALCFPEESWDPQDFAGILAMAGTSGHFVRSEHDSTVRGFLFDTLLAPSGEIITLGIAPEIRRQGAARILLEDLFRRARARCIARLTLEVADDNEAALALYASLGFQQIGMRQRYYRRGDGREIDAKLLSRVVPA